VSTFTEAEIEFLNEQRLGRLATVGADGMPHVVPVAVFHHLEADTLVIGANIQFGDAVMVKSKKFRDALLHPQVAVVIDAPAPRILEIRGEADTHLDGGEELGRRLGAPFRFARAYIEIRPRRIVSMGVNDGHFGSSGRNVSLPGPSFTRSG
jgi:pyridoxamine 5'-phosphate oxidase family protein